MNRSRCRVISLFVHVWVSFHITLRCNSVWFPLLSPSCSHAPAGGMLHSKQQRHVVMETAAALHHHRGGIHPGAGRWKWGAVQGRFVLSRYKLGYLSVFTLIAEDLTLTRKNLKLGAFVRFTFRSQSNKWKNRTS